VLPLVLEEEVRVLLLLLVEVGVLLLPKPVAELRPSPRAEVML
jgi:hypothetical protein